MVNRTWTNEKPNLVHVVNDSAADLGPSLLLYPGALGRQLLASQQAGVAV